MLWPMHYLDDVAERSCDIPFEELIARCPVLESVRGMRTVCPEVMEASLEQCGKDAARAGTAGLESQANENTRLQPVTNGLNNPLANRSSTLTSLAFPLRLGLRFMFPKSA